MKRALAILSLVLLTVSCGKPAPMPTILGYRLGQLGDLGVGPGGVTAEAALEVDVNNPGTASYVVESLEATLFRGTDTAPYAEVSMLETATIEPAAEQTLSLPLLVTITRPLSLLTGGFDTDLSHYTADIDLTIRRGAFKKNFKQERVPLDQLGQLLGSSDKTGNP